MALVIPPAGPGSAGDEAMLRALVAALGRAGEAVAVARVAPGGSPVPAGCRAVEAPWAAARTPRWGRVIVVGADVMDGFYGPEVARERVGLLVEAAAAGAGTSLVGASLNPDPHPSALEALRSLPPSARVCWRDPRSRRRAGDLLGRSGTLTSDLAFLLRPDRWGARGVLAWVDARRGEGRRVVGVNANGLLPRLATGWSLASAARAHADLIAAMCAGAPDLAVVLIPHDNRPGADDGALATRVHALLGPVVARRCRVARGLGPAAIKALCGRLELVVSGRMHLAVAALGAGTPAVCMAYQGKVEGLFEHFGLDGPIFAPDDLARPEALAGVALDALESPRLAGRIRRALPSVLALAMGNVRDDTAPPPGAPGDARSSPSGGGGR